MSDFTAIISGAGPAGLVAAILLAQDKVKCAVVAPARLEADMRTVALMQPAMRLLKYIGVWPGSLEAVSAPLKQLHLIDDTGNLVQAPPLKFSAGEVALDAFGWNIPLSELTPVLHARAIELGVEFIVGRSQNLISDAKQATLVLDDGRKLTAQVVLAADGVNSPLRKSIGVAMMDWKFDQCALATSFSHTASHQDISVEWHKPAGPFATVPLPGLRSSLVWLERPQRVAELMAMSDDELACEIQIESHGQLGKIFDMGPRKSFPMAGRRATQFAKNRCLLLAEAAHVFPPIGAQGLNLSLRDAGFAADVIIGADDAGNDTVMAAYEKARSVDIATRQQAVSLMNYSLLSDSLPFSLMRVAGLALVNSVPPLRQQAMREGLSPSSGLPFAMRA